MTTTTSPAFVTPGGSLTLDSEGEAGALVATFGSLERADVGIPGVLGLFVPALAPLLPFGHVVLDASGAGVFAIGVPLKPALAGKELTHQSAGFSPSATLTLSNPSFG